jgi:predicted dehydrogenase
MSGSARKRIALVGAGHIAQSHILAARAVADRAEVVAVVEVDHSRLGSFATQHSIAGRYDDLDAMLRAEHPDLAIICSPPYLHADQIATCLSSGVWVLCEKPICGSLAALDALELAEVASTARCSSVFQWRFGERVQQFKELIRTGALGRALVVSCLMTWYRDQAYYSVPWRGKWATELGGPTVGAGIHFMDLILWLLGDWQQVTAMVDTLDRDIEMEDVSIAAVRLASGALVSVVNSVLSPRQETALRFDFERATVELRCLYSYEDHDWTYTPLSHETAELGALWRPVYPTTEDRHAVQLSRFLDALEGKADVAVSLADIRPTYDLMTSLYKAAATGHTVGRSSIGPGDPFYQHFAGTLVPAR